jgi:hypothetical protein
MSTAPPVLPPEQDYRFFFSAFFHEDFWELAQALRFLAVLESTAAKPEFWGPGGVLAGKYMRLDLERYLLENHDPRESRPPLRLKRSTAPRYQADLNVGNGVHPHSFHLTSDLRHQDGELKALFDMADVLASAFLIEFGTVDINREAQPPETRLLRSGTTANLDVFVELGFHDIWARNYFGPRTVELAGGLPAFQVEGAIVRMLVNGAVALDLHPEAWTADPADLKKQQQLILPQLKARTGLFYATEGEKLYPGVPGRNWKSPPDARIPR